MNHIHDTEDYFVEGLVADESVLSLRRELTRLRGVMEETIRYADALDQDIAIRQSQTDPVLQRNRKWKDYHAGERCFVLGLGPSLSALDLSKLEGETVFGISRAWKVEGVPSIRYYCLSPATFFQSGARSTDEEVEIFWDGVLAKCPGSIYFMPREQATREGPWRKLPEDQAWYLKNLPRGLCHGVSGDLELASGIPQVLNALQWPILVALYMGFKEVILLGADYDFLQKKVYDYAFGKKTGKVLEVRKRSSQGDLYWMAWNLWRSHISLRELAEKQGTTVWNATAGSQLDVYQERPFESFFESR